MGDVREWSEFGSGLPVVLLVLNTGLAKGALGILETPTHVSTLETSSLISAKGSSTAFRDLLFRCLLCLILCQENLLRDVESVIFLCKLELDDCFAILRKTPLSFVVRGEFASIDLLLR